MTVITANLTYVDNGVLGEIVYSETPDMDDNHLPKIVKPIRRVFYNNDDVLEFITKEIKNLQPGRISEDVLKLVED